MITRNTAAVAFTGIVWQGKLQIESSERHRRLSVKKEGNSRIYTSVQITVALLTQESTGLLLDGLFTSMSLKAAHYLPSQENLMIRGQEHE